MKITELGLEGVKIIEPRIFPDNRGFCGEMYSVKDMKEAGIDHSFVLDYQAYNAKKHTFRGIHIQAAPYTQAKIVRVLSGAVLDVAVDLRKNSPTYKKWVSAELSEKNQKQILIPAGFGHGFVTLEDDTRVLYKFDNYYNGPAGISIRYSDPELAIDWGVEDMIMSDRDRNAPLLKDAGLDF